MSLSGRKIAIAGGASGIGLATARLLASSGAHISLADSNPSVEAETEALPGGLDHHMHTIIDVRSADAVNSWIESTVKRFGRLDGAVNMAGILTEAKPLVDTKDVDWELSFAVNAKGVFNCLRAEIRAMSKDGDVGGSIVSALSILLHDLSPHFTRAILSQSVFCDEC